MIHVIKPKTIRAPNLYLLIHIRKDKIYYKYYTTKKLLELPECVVNIDSFKARLIANRKHKKVHGHDKYRDLWDLITYPLLKRSGGKSRPAKIRCDFNVNLWSAVNHETIK